MTLQNWIDQEKTSSPELSDFLTKITPYIKDSGFNAAEFEKRVGLGIRKVDANIEDSLKPEPDANS